MIRWLKARWYRRCRALDLDLLWPIICGHSGGDLSRARRAFAVHCQQDEAWRALGAEELDRRILALPWVPDNEWKSRVAA